MFVSRPNLHIGSTVSLKPCLNLCSFKWLKFNLIRVSSLRPLLWCTAKAEFSLGLWKLRIIYLNFQEWHFGKQKMLSISYKLSCVSHLLRNKNYNYINLIYIYIIYFIYIYIILYIYICIYYIYKFTSQLNSQTTPSSERR